MLQFMPELIGIAQVSIVCNRQCSFDVAHDKRLGILPDARARGGLPHMADSDLALQFPQNFIIEGLRHQSHIFITGNDPLVVYGNAAALLPSVLEGQEPVVCGICRVQCAIHRIDAEYAALLMWFRIIKLHYRTVQKLTILIKLWIVKRTGRSSA